jgi:FMN reductase
MLIVALGGTTRPGSSSERALRVALEEAERRGAQTAAYTAAELDLPLFDYDPSDVPPAAAKLIEDLRNADGVMIVSPGYHGAISGLLKNALDYVEYLREDARPYLHGRAVGCIAVAQGAQAGASTLGSLRTIVHALRGWPTPLGVAINTAHTPAIEDGFGPAVDEQIRLVTRQVVDFAAAWTPARAAEAA